MNPEVPAEALAKARVEVRLCYDALRSECQRTGQAWTPLSMDELEAAAKDYAVRLLLPAQQRVQPQAPDR